MVTLPQHDVYYKKMMTTSGRKLSKSALETLAIVAYYQPVTRIRIEEIRGVGCESMIRKLLAQALIKEVGRDDSPGKPVLYGVTDEFMDAFNLKSLDELPELKEIESEFDEEDIFNTKYQEKVEEITNDAGHKVLIFSLTCFFTATEVDSAREMVPSMIKSVTIGIPNKNNLE